MIANSSGYKLKASKNHPRTSEQHHEDCDGSVDGDAAGDHRFYGKYRGAPKPRGYDYKASRSSERRGGYRGRREYDVYVPKAEVKFGALEDTRISKLLRRLSVEDDQENSLQISAKLLDVLLLPDNAVYVRKSFHILRDSILHILQVAPGVTAKRQVARALGRMGYILASEYFDFNKYLKVVLKQGGFGDEMACLFMDALKETLDMERRKPLLDKNGAYCLMQELLAAIESTENVDVFKATLDNLMSVVEFHPSNFCEYFKDTTDLLFGWHVDPTQPLANIEYISRNLRRIAGHFQMNLEFSVTLFVHFVDDVETYTKQFAAGDCSAVEQATVSVLALNTVLKCLTDEGGVAVGDLFTATLISDALRQVVATTVRALDSYVPDNLVIAGNESVKILLSLLPTKGTSLKDSVLKLVDVELSAVDDLSDAAIVSSLLMIAGVVKELSANLPQELMAKLVGPGSPVVRLRFSRDDRVREATVAVYQALLNLKNIPLLQEAYKYMLGDLEVAYNVIVPNDADITSLGTGDADLTSTGADLSASGANLTSTRRNLTSIGANLTSIGANLTSIEANLTAPNLTTANVLGSDANLTSTGRPFLNLSSANRSGANLTLPNLTDAHLSSDANLTVQTLTAANLRSDANITSSGRQFANLTLASPLKANLSLQNSSDANQSADANLTSTGRPFANLTSPTNLTSVANLTSSGRQFPNLTTAGAPGPNLTLQTLTPGNIGLDANLTSAATNLTAANLSSDANLTSSGRHFLVSPSRANLTLQSLSDAHPSADANLTSTGRPFPNLTSAGASGANLTLQALTNPAFDTSAANLCGYFTDLTSSGANPTLTAANLTSTGANPTSPGTNLTSRAANLTPTGGCFTDLASSGAIPSSPTFTAANLTSIGANPTSPGTNLTPQTSKAANLTLTGPSFSNLTSQTLKAANLTSTGPNLTLTDTNLTSVGPNPTSTGPNSTLTGPNLTLTGANLTLADPNLTSFGPNLTLTDPNLTSTGPNLTLTGPNLTSTGGHFSNLTSSLANLTLQTLTTANLTSTGADPHQPDSPLARNPYADVVYTPEEAEWVCLYLLRCLSQLANASGSIIGMWALKPSILELLAVRLRPHSSELALRAPALRYSLLHLLYSHCRCYNHFMSSSALVNVDGPTRLLGQADDVTTRSPNSGNLSTILEVVRRSLGTKGGSREATVLLLRWFGEILVVAEPYLEVLYLNEEFLQVVAVLIECGRTPDPTVAVAVADNLRRLLSDKQLSWKKPFLVDVHRLCALHATSVDVAVREAYSGLSANVPWDVAVVEHDRPDEVAVDSAAAELREYTDSAAISARRLHMNGSVFGEMPPHHFKALMGYLLSGDGDEGLVGELFGVCWPLEADNQELSDRFRWLCGGSRLVLLHWATWEAAQLCVNNKLRTPLGKPNETFTSFENALKSLARDVAQSNGGNVEDRKRVRLLLQFVEHLEMCMYNAWEGTAAAVPPPSKPVRTFFSTNASTCREWLGRIRAVLVQLALHAGRSVVALRHGQELLADLATVGKVDTADFERGVVNVAAALLRLEEPEALLGLYAWCKNLGRKFPWLKCVADQAGRKYELAVAAYRRLEAGDLDARTQRFIADCTVDCYKELNDWRRIVEYQDHVDNGKRSSWGTVDMEVARAIYDVETSGRALEEMGEWKEAGAGTSWSVYDALVREEREMYKVALGAKVEGAATVDASLERIREAVRENVLYSPSEFLQEFCLLNYVGCGLKNVLNDAPASTTFLVSENFEEDVDKIDSSTLSKILWWSERFAKVQNQGFATFLSNLRLNIVKKARKESNHELATAQLRTFLSDKGLVTVVKEQKSPKLLHHIAECLRSKIPEIALWSADTAKATHELIKLLYDDPNDRRTSFDLSALASTSISKCADMYRDVDLKRVSSKILLKLAGWLQSNETRVVAADLQSPLGKLLMVLPEIAVENVGSIPIDEMVIGKLLQFSVAQCQTLAKTWNAFGTWCYRWGRKIVDQGSDLTLGVEDRAAIVAVLPADTSEDDEARIMAILAQTRAYVDEEDIDSSEANTSEMIRGQLRDVGALHGAPEARLDALVQIWRDLQRRIYAYYGLSVDAYFKYLHLATNSDNVGKSTESSTITVTLRLLRLIVKHALELQDVLEEGLATTPTHPWKVIVPQLFSRLSHPEGYVRERVSELLCRVAEDAPHLITFPAVVGALEGGVKFDFSDIQLPKDCLSQNAGETDDMDEAYDSDDEGNGPNGGGGKDVLRACFRSMVETLSKQASETISQVQLLVKELRRIILLWDELWLGTLAQHHGEISRRQRQLEAEIEKVNANQHLDADEKISLITEKHRIIIKPIVFILEQLHDITGVEPETPHERHFQERYSATIDDVLRKLKNPRNPDRPQESWKLLKELQAQFQQKAHKRTLLKMQDISPVLANIRDTVISMPGQAFRTKVRISHVSNQVSILPTKTKPKKLVFHGSDGRTYTYLFKGLEDLHLDERIMQFLSIANTMMAQNADNLYRARHYSVIPLGPRSGLISWVAGTTPVFTLYKRWQQREASKAPKQPAPVLRPSELFYNKLNPLLQEHGVKNPDNRKEWPLVVLKQVLAELTAETPGDLLARELWCHSTGPGVWWRTVRKYTYSVAVMSVIGYIIGLGDRHLDNVLVDLSTGEVVHIDYNVCFEKGKTLRVPEKVPFRLTPNIRRAFGVTGIEGMFRLACENVLKTMKKGRETLLTLLEAFVYDPLIDWTVGNDGLVGTTFGGMPSNSVSRRQTRRDLEKEVTLAMYRVRCTELKNEWEQNRKNIEENLPKLLEHLQRWRETYDKSKRTEDTLQDLHQQMALVKEAEANGVCKNAFHTLPGRFEAYRKTQDALKAARRDLRKLVRDLETQWERYAGAVKTLQGQQVHQWYAELSVGGKKERSFDLVKEFLQNAGQSSTVGQCEQSDNDVLQSVEQQNIATLKCLTSLQDYLVVYSQCPISYVEEHRVYKYLTLARRLEASDDLRTCEDVYHEFFAYKNRPAKQSAAVLQFSYGLNLLYGALASQAATVFEQLHKYRATDDRAVLETGYAEAERCFADFLKHDKCAAEAAQFALLNEMLYLNCAVFAVEKKAAANGCDELLRAKTTDCEWFLDELTTSANSAVELVNRLRSVEDDDELARLGTALRAANAVYAGLNELYVNFHTIILPESMKKIQSEEPTVVQMVRDLGAVVAGAGASIGEMVGQLEKYLTCVVMEMDCNSTYDVLHAKLAALKLQFQSLLHSPDGVLSPGKMLLMGFNGLFDKLCLETNNVVAALAVVEVPPSWRKVDHVRNSRSLSAPMFNPRVRAVLDDIFLLKRIHTMVEFFKSCLGVAAGFKGTDGAVLTDEQLLFSVRRFIAEFVSRQFSGVMSELIAYVICASLRRMWPDLEREIEQNDIGAESCVPLEELLKKAFSNLLKSGALTHNLASQASSIELNLKSTWDKLQEPKRLERKVALLQSSVGRVQNQISLHGWLFDDVLKPEKSVRAKFVADLRHKSNSLNALQCRVMEARERQKALIASVDQRLKWAAGANPDLQEVLSAFENAVAERDRRLDVEYQIGNAVLATCTGILQHEVTRGASNETAVALDKAFLAGHQKWTAACRYGSVKVEPVSPVEENIMRLYTPDMSGDPKWIGAISEKISDAIKVTQKEADEYKSGLQLRQLSIGERVDALKLHYAEHTKIMNDFKLFVKSMLKIDECSAGAQRYVAEYRLFVERFAEALHKLKRDGVVESDDVEAAVDAVEYVENRLRDVYDGLWELEARKNGATRPQLVRQDGLQQPARPPKQESMTKGQQRNAYAVGVWRRVRMKLEGRDPDPGRKYTTQEQVDYIIREATSLDNLALLYEGWTPWV